MYVESLLQPHVGAIIAVIVLSSEQAMPNFRRNYFMLQFENKLLFFTQPLEDLREMTLTQPSWGEALSWHLRSAAVEICLQLQVGS